MRKEQHLFPAVVAAACLVALVSALPYAGSWYDGSRLATVESLVDHGTWAIDDSIFVEVPGADQPSPYPRTDRNLRRGTLDKLFINGHYYSDKPPLLALYLAGIYQVWEWLGGPPARLRPDLFCYLMTIAGSGLGYVLAVSCTFRMACVLRLPATLALGLTASLALATFALTYTRHVNSHIVFLGLMSGVFLMLARGKSKAVPKHRTPKHILLLGMLAGACYTTDLGAGPVLVLCLGVFLIWSEWNWKRRLGTLVLFGLAALPCFVVHHAINYSIGGSFQPANTNPQYSDWPGCPFNAANLTGGWNHSPGHFVVYALAMLAGKRGLLGHNLPFFLVVAGVFILRRRTFRERPELMFAVCWSAGTWLLYAALSNNSSGACCSIRWFVPLLAPGYFVLALLLRECPECSLDFGVLSLWGAVLSAIMWWNGPWILHMVPLFWPIQAAALTTWILCRRYLPAPRLAPGQLTS